MEGEIWVPFLSTFSGVLIAFLLGIFGQFCMQWLRERQQRNQTKLSLRQELGYLKEQVAGVLNTEAGAAPYVDIPADVKIGLPTDAKESALASGR